MTTLGTHQPAWGELDGYTADLLDLIGTEQTPPVDYEWQTFVEAALRIGTRDGGLIDQNDLRPMIRGLIAPKRIGPFYRRACLEGWLRAEGWSTSTDTEGRNAGRPMRTYYLIGDPTA